MAYFVDESDWLAHHGVKGMKWGQHLFGRDRRGSVGRKGGSGQAKKSPSDPLKSDDPEWEAIRQGIRKMRYEEHLGLLDDEIKPLSKAGQKVDQDIVYADADREAIRDELKTSFSEKAWKRYEKASENLMNSYAKGFAAMRAEIDDAIAKGDTERRDAASLRMENYREDFNFVCRNYFQYGDTVNLEWSQGKVPFNYNGKKLMAPKATVKSVSPIEMEADWQGEQKYVKKIWDMQDMFDEYVYPKR